jgi:hypothetical protein
VLTAPCSSDGHLEGLEMKKGVRMPAKRKKARKKTAKKKATKKKAARKKK